MREHLPEPAWLTIARGELERGVFEIRGSEDHPRVVEYHGATAAGEAPDEVAWCSSFANFCTREAGIKGTRRKNARSWLDWGLELAEPRPGAIAVFARGTSPTQGHVGFVMGIEASGDLWILGGNQSNAVSVGLYSKGRLLGLRWPEGVPL